jgi:hypothetical protein
MKKRPELRIIISSATIDAEDFMEYFNSNAGGEDRTKDDAVSKSLFASHSHRDESTDLQSSVWKDGCSPSKFVI